MADAGVARDPGRLPWLEPYRAPSRKKSNRRPGVAATIGAAGLAAVLILLMRDASFFEPRRTGSAAKPSVVLPAPADMQPPDPAAATDGPEPAAAPAARTGYRRFIAPRPGRSAGSRRCRRSAAYRAVVKEQSARPASPSCSDAAIMTAAAAIAAAAASARSAAAGGQSRRAGGARQDGPAGGLQDRTAGRSAPGKAQSAITPTSSPCRRASSRSRSGRCASIGCSSARRRRRMPGSCAPI